MKKNNTKTRSSNRANARQQGPPTIGMDLGDKTSRYSVVGGSGEVSSESSGDKQGESAKGRKKNSLRKVKRGDAAAPSVGRQSEWRPRSKCF